MMNMRSAIKQSCDVYFYELARRLGVDRLSVTAKSFGLGKKTLENCDFTLKINMNGVVESLNMAVATGIIINTIHSKIK